MAVHELHPTSENLHGKFSSALPPILRVASGDRIVASTLDADWGLIEQRDPYDKPVKIDVASERMNGHALLGPIEIEGALPGDLLEIRLETIRPGRWGWASAGGWPSEFNQRLGLVDVPHYRMQWRVDPDAATATGLNGRTVSLWPFLGWIGLMPAEPGLHSTTPPRRTGGNLDCRELVAGTSLFLPVEMPGGMLSFGDGHAVQGDGEVAGPALECPMERVQMSLVLHPGKAARLPFANTPAGWVSLGFAEKLDDAMYDALDCLVERISNALGMPRAEAMSVASLKASLRITQIVNETKGVHALLPSEALREFGLRADDF